jgi:hypothetical protein
MNATYENLPGLGEKIVYVRSVLVADLPDEVKKQAGGAEYLYAVHDSEGVRMAIAADRAVAFALAREHDFAPVSVH